MDLQEEVRNHSHGELTDMIIEQINVHLNENIKGYKRTSSSDLNFLDRLLTQYYLLGTCIRDSREEDKFRGRFFFGKHYLKSISGNFYAIRDLYSKGLHVPFQLLLRGQVELVNTYIAFIGDDSFYMRYGVNKPGTENFLTPKPSHSEKALQRIIKEYNSEDFKEFWSIFGEMMKHFYGDLSEAAHGNIPRIALHSLEEKSDDEDFLLQPILGVSKPLPALDAILKECLNYFQITYRFAYLQLEKKNMLNLESPFIDYVKHYSDKFESK